MFSIAIVEDDELDTRKLITFCTDFSAHNNFELSVSTFVEATSFLEKYKPVYDLIFMDIEMPNMNGLQAAHHLHDIDSGVSLVFVTNMAQYAAQGYEVDAADYIIKPYTYSDFERKITRIINRRQRASQSILVQQRGGMVKLLVRDIEYVESKGHNVIFNMSQNSVVSRGSLQNVEEKLHNFGFLRCNKAYIVNPRFIAKIQGNDVVLTNGELLRIGRTRKKEFMEGLAAVLGEKW